MSFQSSASLERDRRRRQDARQEAAAHIRASTGIVPEAAIILGSGLGGLADAIEAATVFDFAELPGFGTSTAGGHRGQLLMGRLGETNVVAMAGRFHRYEGWSNDDVSFPVRVMAALGASRLIVSNAAGGLNPKLNVGDILVIRDHINLMGGSFSDRSSAWNLSPLHHGEVYDSAMSAAAIQAGLDHQFAVMEGTYLATLGPTYETRSEYRMMRRIGADVAGMSTIPEVLAATSEGMRVLGLSMVSNVATPDHPVKADHQEVLEAGRAAEVKMDSIVRSALRTL